MKKSILTIVLCFLLLSLKAQHDQLIKQDTLLVTLSYSDTSCHFNSNDLQSIYNSRCIKNDTAYIIYGMYTNEFLDIRKQPISTTKYNIWSYQLISKRNGKKE